MPLALVPAYSVKRTQKSPEPRRAVQGCEDSVWLAELEFVGQCERDFTACFWEEGAERAVVVVEFVEDIGDG